MDEFVLFLIEMIPLAIIIGIAAACIGYTAWGIVVPLLFVGFGFPIFDAIVISLLVDFINSIILTGRYSTQGKVDFKEGTKWGLIALGSAMIAAFFAVGFLSRNENLLRGSLGYIFFLLSGFFIFRGFNLGKKEKAEASGESMDDKEKKELSDKAKTGIMFAGVVISGVLSGLLGIGSGSNYTLLFIFIGGFETLRATGTSCYIMAMVTAVLSIFFIAMGLVNFTFIMPYLVVCLIFSAIGTIIGSSITLKVSESKLNYMVGVAIFITALVSSIQAVMLN